jgi:hypothetical protein
MKKKLTLAIAGGVAVLSMLVPMSSNAAQVKPACVVVNGPHGFRLQVGYAPTGPSGCRQLP